MELKFSKPNTGSSNLQVSPDYLREIVEKLSFERVYGTPPNKAAAKLIKHEFKKIGLEASITSGIGNVVAGNLDSGVLIGSHYDSVPGTFGADDNASAIAGMLAAAKVLGDKACYVSFNCEEYGLAGSQEFVDTLQGRTFNHVHILEMIGYCSKEPLSQKSPLPIDGCPTVGDFLGVVSNRDSMINSIIEAGGKVNIPVVGFGIPENMPLSMIRTFSPHILRSDHAPFWAVHIPATMWTDTSEFRNPHYHEATDTPDTLDYEFMAEVVQLLININRM